MNNIGLDSDGFYPLDPNIPIGYDIDPLDDEEELSECCSAELIGELYICSDCKEHCG